MNGFCCWLLQCVAEYALATALNHALKLLREKAFEKHRRGKHFRKAK